jgi:polysaccharide export outer membrane protein
MATLNTKQWASILIILMGAFLAAAQERPKTSKELFEYINEARKLGLKDDQIRKNALAAGWDQSIIDQTYAIVRLLNNEKDDSPRAVPQALPEGYRIGAGDVLQIAVWKEADASVPEVVVRADGKISVPLVKEIDVLGLTPKDLEKLLTEKLSRLINDPDVTVVAKKINSLKVYLAGAVRKEGSVPLLGPMTVLQAINEAGGLTEYAKKKKIYVLRPEGGKQTRLPFNYEDVIKGGHPEQNILLKPNDMIVVPN